MNFMDFKSGCDVGSYFKSINLGDPRAAIEGCEGQTFVLLWAVWLLFSKVRDFSHN